MKFIKGVFKVALVCLLLTFTFSSTHAIDDDFDSVGAETINLYFELKTDDIDATTYDELFDFLFTYGALSIDNTYDAVPVQPQDKTVIDNFYNANAVNGRAYVTPSDDVFRFYTELNNSQPDFFLFSSLSELTNYQDLPGRQKFIRQNTFIRPTKILINYVDSDLNVLHDPITMEGIPAIYYDYIELVKSVSVDKARLDIENTTIFPATTTYSIVPETIDGYDFKSSSSPLTAKFSVDDSLVINLVYEKKADLIDKEPPTDPTKPIAPVEPIKPVEPAHPTEPTNPAEPSIPLTPLVPITLNPDSDTLNPAIADPTSESNAMTPASSLPQTGMSQEYVGQILILFGGLVLSASYLRKIFR